MSCQEKKNISEKGSADQKGSSLAVVICIAALMMAFSLAMVYTGGLLMSRANQRKDQERVYQLAESFAGVLDGELKKYTIPDDTGTPSDSFYSYAYKFLEGQYGEYDPDNPEETIFHYTAGDPGGDIENQYGKIKVVLYKENDEEQDDEMSGEFPGSQSPDHILSQKIQRYIFTVEVTAEIDGITDIYSTEYRQMAVYGVSFSHNGTPIMWGTDNKWHSYGSADEYVVPADALIHFQYTDSEILSCEFENAYDSTSKAGTEEP